MPPGHIVTEDGRRLSGLLLSMLSLICLMPREKGKEMTLTRDEILAMPPEQLRIEIAQRKGYTVCTSKFFDAFELILDRRVLAVSHTRQDAWRCTPNWPTSFADAWELEDGVPENETQAYYDQVYKVIAEDRIARGMAMVRWDIYHGSPLERSRAWLLWHVTREGAG